MSHWVMKEGKTRGFTDMGLLYRAQARSFYLFFILRCYAMPFYGRSGGL